MGRLAFWGLKDANFTLSNSSLSYTGGPTIPLADVEVANLTGGVAENTFTVAGWTGTGTLDGAGGTGDKVVFGKDATDIGLDGNGTANLTATGGPSLTLTGIEAAELTGGAGGNTFTIQNWAGKSATLAGSSGADAYKFGNRRDCY